MSLNCLNTLVGLSATDYACFTDTQPADFDESTSGFYLTDTDYGLTVSEQCETDGWTMLTAARTQAIKEFKSDMRAALRQMYKQAIPNFSGLIGKLKHTAAVTTVTGTHVGVRFRVTRMKSGAYLTINKIYLGLNASGSYTLKIRSNDPLFSNPADVTLTATANAFSGNTLADAIDLPLWSRTCPDDYLEYYFTIERGSAKPLNNTFTCCGNTPVWMQFVKADGVQATSVNADNAYYFTEAQGFAFDAFLQCADLDWVCEVQEINDYATLDVVARAIQFRGAAIAISALLDNIQVSPCTGYQAENLNAKRNWLNKRYSENINWLAVNLPTGVTDCFRCKDEKVFKNAQILV